MKVKVIHIADKFGVRGSSVHGVSRLFSWWFPRFDTSRYDVRLVGLRKPDAAEANLKKQGVEVLSLGKHRFDPTTIAAIIKIIRQERPHILHLHGYGSTNFGRMAARLTNIKAIVHEHFVDPAMPFYQGPIDHSLARFTDYGIAVSKSVKEFMVKKRHMPEEKVQVVFNGAPLEKFKPVPAEHMAEVRSRWQIPADKKVIATIGRLDEQKGNCHFITAAAQVLRRRDDVIFMLVGDGPLMESLKAQCEAEGIADRVIFTGFSRKVPEIQSIVDIQVFPSLWEGTPLTLFEAMSMGRPIVATHVDGLGEVLRHEQTGMLVAPSDPLGLAKAMLVLLERPGLAHRLAEQAQVDSHQYDIQTTVNTMQAIYDKLLSPGYSPAVDAA